MEDSEKDKIIAAITEMFCIFAKNFQDMNRLFFLVCLLLIGQYSYAQDSNFEQGKRFYEEEIQDFPCLVLRVI